MQAAPVCFFYDKSRKAVCIRIRGIDSGYDIIFNFSPDAHGAFGEDANFRVVRFYRSICSKQPEFRTGDTPGFNFFVEIMIWEMLAVSDRKLLLGRYTSEAPSSWYFSISISTPPACPPSGSGGMP